MKILSLYASLNGQTEKVARAIEQAVEESGHTLVSVNLRKDSSLIDLTAYDFVFVGSGVYTWLPCKTMLDWMKKQMDHARSEGLIKAGSPRLAGKHVCVYCTYAGPHTGEAEAVPALKYMGQLFDHLGMTIADEWPVVGAFVPQQMQDFNTQGRLGNIEGRPDAADLQRVGEKTKGLLQALHSVTE